MPLNVLCYLLTTIRLLPWLLFQLHIWYVSRKQ